MLNTNFLYSILVLCTFVVDYSNPVVIRKTSPARTKKPTPPSSPRNRFVYPGEQFQSEDYLKHIEKLAKERDYKMNFKVKMDQTSLKRKLNKKSKYASKSKSYAVPLKRKSMKLSALERLMRQIANDKHAVKRSKKVKERYLPMTTEPAQPSTYTKYIGKYKPSLYKVKMNYTKRITPVKSGIIIL